MGLMRVGSLEEYQSAVRALLPRGEFWDKQLEDGGSDVSRWCDAQAAEILRFQTRKAALAAESVLVTTAELIDDWERIAGVDNASLSTDVRRRILQESKTTNLTPAVLQSVADAFGAIIVAISHPLSPALFGFSRFASRLATAGAWNVLYLYIILDDIALREAFEQSMMGVLLANHLTIFFYRTATDEYVPG
jgi:uncharacterized protein YmfQ (DUF2313 family)